MELTVADPMLIVPDPVLIRIFQSVLPPGFCPPPGADMDILVAVGAAQVKSHPEPPTFSAVMGLAAGPARPVETENDELKVVVPITGAVACKRAVGNRARRRRA